MPDKVCGEFFERFPSGNANFKHEDRVEFMLLNPTIKVKLDEWVKLGKSEKENSSNTTISNNNSGDETEKISKPEIGNDQVPAYKHEKSAAHSVLKREEGNHFFKQRKLYDSMQCYNEAIRFATFDPLNLPPRVEPSNNGDSSGAELEDQSLTIALANRSALYFDMGEKFWKKSLNDADSALKYGYPKRLKTKVVLRKLAIYSKIGSISQAEEYLKEAKEFHTSLVQEDKSKNNSEFLEKITKLEVDIQNRNEVSTSSASSTSTPSPDEAKSTRSSSFMNNSKFENASKSVKLNYSEESTRYVTCTQDLKVGDIIFREEPFASVLVPEFYEAYCQHCHRRLEDDYFFPCRNCTQVKFCGEACSEAAWVQYHEHECLFLDLMHSVGIAHLSLRVVLTAGVDEVLRAINKKDIDTYPPNVSVFFEGQSKYQRVYSLLDHSHSMYPEDVFQYALTAALLTNFLQKKTCFLKGVELENQMKIGGAILRHICQLICNAHAITDIVSDFNTDKVSLSTSEESQMRIASAIYPSASMMNHSCDPNISFAFVDGKHLVVKVTTDLKRRAEIYNCYGPHFRRMNLKQRQEALKEQYFFTCQCKPCEKEKEEGVCFVDKFNSFKCEKCEGPIIPDENNETFLRECLECGKFQNIRDKIHVSMQTDRAFLLGNGLLDQGSVEEALKTFQTVYEGRKNALYKLNSEVGEVCDTLGRCHAILGEFSEAVAYVKESLEYVEHRFGSLSIEYARELKKYADLVIRANAARTTEAEELIKKSKAILDFSSTDT